MGKLVQVCEGNMKRRDFIKNSAIGTGELTVMKFEYPNGEQDGTV